MTEEVHIDGQQELPLLTFNALYNILREEKKSKQLQSFPPLFYEALEKFLESKKTSIRQLKERKEDQLLKKERNVLNNSKKIAKEIISLRAQKIAKIAIQNALSQEKILEETNVLENELQLLENVSKQLKNLTKKI